MMFPMPSRCSNGNGRQESLISPVDDRPAERNNCSAFRDCPRKKAQVDTLLSLSAGP